MTRYHIEVRGTKTFKTHIEVDAVNYDAICAAGDSDDYAAVKNILTEHSRWDFSDAAVKLKRIEVDLYDEDDNLIATDIEI
jgi:hypothetical protein